MIWTVIWYWLLSAVTAADIITTRIGISRGAREINPFLAPVLDHLIELKIMALVACIVLAYFIEKSHPGESWVPVAAGTCLTFGAVVSNILHLAAYPV